MIGIDANTGRDLGGMQHLGQSIGDILMTPLGSRVMRRDYGSRIFRLVDAPMNRSTLLDIYAATAEALARWEPRFRLQRVTAESAAPGAVTLSMTGEYLPYGRVLTIEGVRV